MTCRGYLLTSTWTWRLLEFPRRASPSILSRTLRLILTCFLCRTYPKITPRPQQDLESINADIGASERDSGKFGAPVETSETTEAPTEKIRGEGQKRGANTEPPPEDRGAPGQPEKQEVEGVTSPEVMRQMAESAKTRSYQCRGGFFPLPPGFLTVIAKGKIRARRRVRLG